MWSKWSKWMCASTAEHKWNPSVSLFFQGAQQPEGEAAEPDPWFYWSPGVSTFSALLLFVCWRPFRGLCVNGTPLSPSKPPLCARLLPSRVPAGLGHLRPTERLWERQTRSVLCYAHIKVPAFIIWAAGENNCVGGQSVLIAQLPQASAAAVCL